MKSHASLEQTLRRIPWFLDFSQEQIERLAQIATWQEVNSGEYVFKDSERCDFLILIVEGQVELEIEIPNHGQVPFFTAEALDIIGWSSLTPIVRQRTASARATQPSLLISIQSKLLEQLCEDDHDLGFIIMRRVANLVANRLLTTRVFLMEMIAQASTEEHGLV